MEDVIILTSGSEEDSDVEFVGPDGSSAAAAAVPPISSVRVDVSDSQIPIGYIDLKQPKWSVLELKCRKRPRRAFASEVVDLTDDLTSDTKLGKEDSRERPTERQSSTKPHRNFKERRLKDEFRVSVTMQDKKTEQSDERGESSPVKHQPQANEGPAAQLTPFVKLKRLSQLETQVTELKTLRKYVCLSENSPLKSELLRQVETDNASNDCSDHSSAAASAAPGTGSPSVASGARPESANEFHSLETAADSRCSEGGNSVTSLTDRSPRGDKWGDFWPSTPLPSSSPPSRVDGTRPPEEASGDPVLRSPAPPSPSKTEDMDEGSAAETYRADPGMDGLMTFLWQDGSDGEEASADGGLDLRFREASREELHYVCPHALGKVTSMPSQVLDGEDEDTPEVLCRQSLSLVYSTMDESYSEGTLQLLSDLLLPGYYPPKDITSHLLHGILLDPQCPPHLCVHAFHLLMRTQRHHMADKDSFAWDWDLLTSILDNQEKKHRCEVVRMVMEYVVQTLEDDFHFKRSQSAHHHSIAKATLSCDQHFPQVRDVIKWLFSAIMKSTEVSARERDEQIRIVSFLQRMLSLALEVDCSPALSSAKLSQELFHMLIRHEPLRAHRMLLLESLQSKLLSCKLLEHLLEYTCPEKIPLPMSLSLLLHFLKHCSLTPDPADGTERWRKWEELVNLLWMLLLSYNKAMKGYLCSSGTEQRRRAATLVYKPHDRVTRHDIREAVDAFLSRSLEDIGQALPLHVEESLTYLQDYLLDVCQC